MQTTCTFLQTDNHTNTSSFNFYGPDALHDAQSTVSKQRRQKILAYNKQTNETAIHFA